MRDTILACGIAVILLWMIAMTVLLIAAHLRPY